jgi:hypothetical protein
VRTRPRDLRYTRENQNQDAASDVPGLAGAVPDVAACPASNARQNGWGKQGAAREQVENSSLYFEEANRTWFLFTNHVGLDGIEFTDAVWVYWSKDLNRWDPARKAVVLDAGNCSWSKHIIGLPSVIRVGDRLALFYDGNAGAKRPEGVKSHMNRDIGLAWLRLPLTPPETK